MSDLERLLAVTRELESALRAQGAQGRGLHGLVSSIESTLPVELVKQLRWIATVRNQALHEAARPHFNIDDIERTAREALRLLGGRRLMPGLLIRLPRRQARTVWLVTTVAAAVCGLLFAPADMDGRVVAIAAAAVVAFGLHPSRQPRVLAAMVLLGALAALVVYLSCPACRPAGTGRQAVPRPKPRG